MLKRVPVFFLYLAICLLGISIGRFIYRCCSVPVSPSATWHKSIEESATDCEACKQALRDMLKQQVAP